MLYKIIFFNLSSNFNSDNNIIITIVMYIKSIVNERSGNVGYTTIEYVATIIPAKKIYIFLFIFCFL